MMWHASREANCVPTSFQAARGLSIPSPKVFERFAKAFRLRPGLDRIVPMGPSRPSALAKNRQSRQFRQFYKTIPIEGAGYSVEETNGIFASAFGMIYPDIPPLPPPALSATEANELSLRHLKSGAGGSQTTELLLSPMGSLRSTAALQLLWRVKFRGVPEPDYVDVDAMTGRIVRVSHNAIWE
jgi:hypothetical protein